MAVRAADPGEARAGVAAVEVALDDLLDDRPEIPVLLLEAPLVFGQEPVEVMEQHTVEDRAFRMSRTIDSLHIGNADSRSVPGAPEGCIGGWAEDRLTTGYTQVSRRRKPANGDPPNLPLYCSLTVVVRPVTTATSP